METDRGEPIVRVMVFVVLVWGLSACGQPVDGRAVPVYVPAGSGCALLGDTPVVPGGDQTFADSR
ncbi:hypothetical protein [Amycolatopsis solani]|uniref:hypothetical protein n=1 Tax=Amycolatopsis solani TaxID=3028615 RepID=UPI0025AF2829|nr:hypothetical protein [Amycolatopsis sp. MEP2-6]